MLPGWMKKWPLFHLLLVPEICSSLPALTKAEEIELAGFVPQELLECLQGH